MRIVWGWLMFIIRFEANLEEIWEIFDHLRTSQCAAKPSQVNHVQSLINLINKTWSHVERLATENWGVHNFLWQVVGWSGGVHNFLWQVVACLWGVNTSPTVKSMSNWSKLVETVWSPYGCKSGLDNPSLMGLMWISEVKNRSEGDCVCEKKFVKVPRLFSGLINFKRSGSNHKFEVLKVCHSQQFVSGLIKLTSSASKVCCIYYF
jgi:hypothetical protein